MNTHYWHPAFVFDGEPDWNRLNELHSSVEILGFKHREEPYWYVLAGVYDLPAEYRELEIPWSWPDDYEMPKSLVVPDAYKDFAEKAGQAALVTHAALPGHFRLGVAVSLLAGVRTFVFEENYEHLPMNMAYVLSNGTVEGFGLAKGKIELWWEHGEIAARWLTSADSPEAALDQACFERLCSMPYVTIGEVGENSAGARNWPLSVWPQAWGDAGSLMGIGLDPPSYEWYRNWRECYWKASPNAPGVRAELFKMVFGRYFSQTWLGKQLQHEALYDDDD